jgi:NUMOD3 motif
MDKEEYEALLGLSVDTFRGRATARFADRGHKRSAEAIRKSAEENRGQKRTEETRKNISAAKKGIKAHIASKETRKKISLANTGKKHSEETRRKISLANTGKKRSEETKLKFKDRIVSEKTKAQLSASNKGKKRTGQALLNIIAGNTGRKHSEETKKKLSELRKGKSFLTDEGRQKIKAASTGRLITDEERIKRSLNSGSTKKVITPIGEFRSAKLAALEYGIHGCTLRDWIKKGKVGFSYID